MPQMSPLPWLILMIMFIYTLMFFMFLINYIYLPKSPKPSTDLLLTTKNWQ
uniref:ATP synthase complex subunit 8 n=1 Tax=Bothropolys sp. SP-2004 TaxID=292347 RepID=A5D6J3_9MYRI|nr:ATPase subunit 8 [Bothropolys sp. SP-2004]